MSRALGRNTPLGRPIAAGLGAPRTTEWPCLTAVTLGSIAFAVESWCAASSVLVLLGVHGCLPPSAADEDDPARVESSAGASAADAPQSVGSADSAQADERHVVDEDMPRPRRARHSEAVRQNAECIRCHPTAAATWRRSRHAQSFTNSAFTRGLAAEPRTFCSDCHAPELDPAKASNRAVTGLGIGCVTCHVTDDGAVLAAPLGTPRKPNAPPMGQGSTHPVRRSIPFGGLGACAGCHEFRFPGRYGDEAESFMQTTVREHLASPTADAPCAQCHMPVRDGRRSHAFAATRNPEWLRSKLTAVAARHGDHARITLEQTTPGHGFPTGDLFRRIEVGIAVVDATGTTLRRERRYLARHLVVEPGWVGRRLVRDDRVFETPVTLQFAVPPASTAIARVEWWVTYQRVLTPGRGQHRESATIESEVPLHAGELTW